MSMRMYVWSVKPAWTAVAYAENSDAARRLLLARLGPLTDGSCQVRDRAREYIMIQPPEIWSKPHGEFSLTDSGIVEEQEIALRGLRLEVDELARRTLHAPPSRERLDIQMENVA